MTDKEIEQKFSRGTTWIYNFVEYRIKGYARYWKHWENGQPKQYDICLYLLPKSEFESLPQFENPDGNYLPSSLVLHYFNFDSTNYE